MTLVRQKTQKIGFTGHERTSFFLPVFQAHCQTSSITTNTELSTCETGAGANPDPLINALMTLLSFTCAQR
ncbi:hypothetical protein BC830DRAFT_1110015 [Chytriomyces sp. MP71]|nr:hypothetical protein BC830DRAFT_1110015 [Chytriomyces sp. MP71]